MTAITAIARARGLFVIEDAAQAIGATWDARPAGSLGDAACFSFFPSKNLGAWGDGGAITTSDPALDARVRRLRQHGMSPRDRDEHTEIGTNSRLDALQAAVLDAKARHLTAWNDARAAAATRYAELLSPVTDRITLPTTRPNCRHVYNQYIIRTADRDALQSHLTAAEIGTRAYYKRPLHQQPCFESYPHPPQPVTEQAARTTLAIPLYPEITPAQQSEVADAIRSFFE
jgi:dTDP-4-amino-4,6-dideoxygalactose transaminase